MLPTLREYQSV